MSGIKVDVIEEANRWVQAVCTCGFIIEGRLLRVFIETGFTCRKCGALGGYTLHDKEDKKPND